MEHKAYVFDFVNFSKELAPILSQSLKSGRSDELKSFITSNLSVLSDPYEGSPLTVTWSEQLDPFDVNQLGDFALTKFYDPKLDIGLGASWERAAELMSGNPNPILGAAFGPPENQFDPGKMGSYFQSFESILKEVGRVEERSRQSPSNAKDLQMVIHMMQCAISSKKGLYVTF